jgi:hypothetical protein
MENGEKLSMDDKQLVFDRIFNISREHWDSFFDLAGTSAGSRESADELLSIVNKLELVLPIDWPNWKRGAELIKPDNRPMISEANIIELIALITLVVRADRFNEGLWEMSVENGLISTLGLTLKSQLYTDEQ